LLGTLGGVDTINETSQRLTTDTVLHASRRSAKSTGHIRDNMAA
jgi:hypothetical protein